MNCTSILPSPVAFNASFDDIDFEEKWDQYELNDNTVNSSHNELKCNQKQVNNTVSNGCSCSVSSSSSFPLLSNTSSSVASSFPLTSSSAASSVSFPSTSLLSPQCNNLFKKNQNQFNPKTTLKYYFRCILRTLLSVLLLYFVFIVLDILYYSTSTNNVIVVLPSPIPSIPSVPLASSTSITSTIVDKMIKSNNFSVS